MLQTLDFSPEQKSKKPPTAQSTKQNPKTLRKALSLIGFSKNEQSYS